MEKVFKGFNHGKGQINLTKHGYGYVEQMLPVEIHLKEDGSIKDEPSFAIVMTAPNTTPVFGQISLEMLNDGLADIGYEIVRKN